MENLISVIVTTYNQEQTIGRTLDGILAQQCHWPIEIIVGEDGSSDGTRAVCERYQQRYPQVVKLMPKAPNKGMVVNYYDCLLATRGKYIADCAGDDCWTDPQKLEKELQVMEADSSVALVHTNWRSYNEETHETHDNTVVPFSAPKTEGKAMLEAIVTQTAAPVVHLCTALYRAETIRQCYQAEPLLYRNNDWGCEDLQLTFMLATRGKIAYLPDITLNYSIGHTSVSCQPDDGRQFRFVWRTARLSFLLAERYHIDTPATRRFFASKAFALLMHAFRCQDKALRAEAIQCMKAWRVAPTAAIRLVLLCTATTPVWSLTRCIRQAVVALKK